MQAVKFTIKCNVLFWSASFADTFLHYTFSSTEYDKSTYTGC